MRFNRAIFLLIGPIAYFGALHAGKLTVASRLRDPWLNSTPTQMALTQLHPLEYETIITQKLYKISICESLSTNKLERITAYSNDMMTFGFSGGNSEGLTGVLEITGTADAYDAFSIVYNATTTGLLNIWSKKRIKQYTSILQLKKGLLFDSADQFFTEYDRGDIKGFISGDIAQGKCQIEIFPTNEPLNCLTIGCGSTNRNVRQNDILDLLARLKIEPLTSSSTLLGQRPSIRPTSDSQAGHE